MKTCTKCGETKPKTEFHKNPGTRDRLRSSCKQCESKKHAAWYAANADKQRIAAAAWKAANPDRVKATRAAYRETELKNTREYYEANKDKRREYLSIWQKNNPDKIRVYNQNRRSMLREANGKLSKGLAERLFKLQRGKCACCGLPLGEDYHLDHIMPLALGGSNTDDNMQLLRARCNTQKKAKHPVEFMQQRGFLL